MHHDDRAGACAGEARQPGQAEGLTRATLETLGERVTGQLTSRGPVASRDRGKPAPARGRRRCGIRGTVRSARIVRRVSGQSGLNEPDATHGVRVFEVLPEATEGRVLVKVRDALPVELQAPVDAGSSGGMRS